MGIRESSGWQTQGIPAIVRMDKVPTRVVIASPYHDRLPSFSVWFELVSIASIP
jgi:hypothetical protein